MEDRNGNTIRYPNGALTDNPPDGPRNVCNSGSLAQQTGKSFSLHNG
jgi:hypothetical protein